jgi:hypothetical protein
MIYRTIILPVVLYGRDTWSLTLREKYRLRVFQNSVLRKIFVPKWYEVIGGWRRQDNKELYVLFSSPNITEVIKSRRIRRVGNVSQMVDRSCVYRVGER